jgi:putative sterol carrier protein
MAKFLSDEYFSLVQAALNQDPKWTESTKNFKSTMAINVTDIGQNYLLNVDNGASTLQKVAPGTGAEFTLDGTYESWTKVAKGEVDIQSAVLRGQLKFRGSLVKALSYKDKLTRVAEILRDVPKEY